MTCIEHTNTTPPPFHESGIARVILSVSSPALEACERLAWPMKSGRSMCVTMSHVIHASELCHTL